MLGTAWADSGARDVYADYNALTLRIATEALFGNSLAPVQGARVRSERAAAVFTDQPQMQPCVSVAPRVQGPLHGRLASTSDSRGIML